MTLNPSNYAEELLEHAGWMRHLARRLVHEDHEDLVQEGWLAALRRTPTTSLLGPWLAKATKNIASNRRRADARRASREEDRAHMRDGVPTPEVLVERSEAHRAVVDAVLALPEPARATVLLRYFEGLSPAEIAKRTNVAQGTVRTRLHRALKALRVELDAGHGGDRDRWLVALTPLAGTAMAPAVPPATASAHGALAAAGLKLFVLAAPLLAFFAWVHFTESPVDKILEDAGAGVTIARISQGSGIRAPEATKGSGRQSARSAMGAAGAQSSGADEDETEPPEGTLAPREIRLVDERTGEPAWGYVLETVPAPGGGPKVQLTSDRSGLVTIPMGVIGVAPIDRMLDRLAVPNEFGGSPGRPDPLALPPLDLPLAVPFGETTRLAIEAPASVNLEGAFAELRVDNGQWQRRLTLAPVREFEGQSFARFPRYWVQDLTGAELWVLTKDGLAGGQVPADRYVGTDRVAPVELQALGALKVVLDTPGGKGLSGVRATLRTVNEHQVPAARPGELGKRIPRHDARIVDGKYQFQFLGLEPSSYEFTHQTRAMLPHKARVQVKPGELTVRRIQLVEDPLEAAIAEISLTFTSATGAYHREMHVLAEGLRPSGPDPQRRTKVQWEETDDGWVGSAKIAGKGRGPYVLEFTNESFPAPPIPVAYFVDKEDRTARPGESKAILIHDDRNLETKTLRVIDAETLEPVEFSRVRYFREGEWEDGEDVQVPGGDVELPHLYKPEEFTVIVRSDKHISVELPPGSLDAPDLTVKLKPGWEGHFIAVDGTDQPIDGIHVMIDGVDAGVTSSTDLLHVVRDRCPDKVSFHAKGWAVVATPTIDANGGVFAGSRSSGRAHFFTVAKK